MKNVRPAKGIEGHLIYTAMGDFMFRVYSSDNSFVDYKILHSDLLMTVIDDDSVLCEAKDGTPVLDHHPNTLGLNLPN